MLNDRANDPPPDWPLRAHARRIRARHDWWVVEHGTGPEILLLHGAVQRLQHRVQLVPGQKVFLRLHDAAGQWLLSSLAAWQDEGGDGCGYGQG